jgi:outer membrane protein OmpA-like peptidoglycan-associated protein
LGIGKLKDPWISISDMMTGLMMIFLFITVSYAHQITKQSENAISKNTDVKEIVLELVNNKTKIAKSLHDEFDKDLEKWGASIDDQNLRIRFESPEVLFQPGKSDVTPLFNEILSDFWPRYLKILSENQSAILEIKIEGHTSSDWSTRVSRNESYFKNMELSQDRSRNVLKLCLQYTPKDLLEWSRSSVTANGFSFSRLIYDDLGREDSEKSRRVEFTIMVRSDEKIDDIEEIL